MVLQAKLDCSMGGSLGGPSFFCCHRLQVPRRFYANVLALNMLVKDGHNAEVPW